MPLVASTRRRSLRRALLAWWDAGHRDLPWRFPQRAADPYRVWLSEVMLQQTQVAAVVPYFRRFVERFPTLASLAAGSEEEVLALWSGLGYYARGRRLHAAAREACERHGGLPADAAALRALPGFGRYTAGAVASIGFALPEPCVDGNVARVLARLFLVEGAPEEGGVRDRLWALAGELVDPARPGDFNQALMELGATVCGKPVPRCRSCPLASACGARRAGRAQELPPARRRRAPSLLRLACAVVRRDGALLLARRPRGGLFGGLWELPSAEVAEDAVAPASLRAALLARGVAASVGPELARVERVLTHRRLVLAAHGCRVRGAVPVGDDLRFVAPDEVARLPMATAARRLLALLDANDGAPARNPLTSPTCSTTLRPRRRASGRKRLTPQGRTV